MTSRTCDGRRASLETTNAKILAALEKNEASRVAREVSRANRHHQAARARAGAPAAPNQMHSQARGTMAHVPDEQLTAAQRDRTRSSARGRDRWVALFAIRCMKRSKDLRCHMTRHYILKPQVYLQWRRPSCHGGSGTVSRVFLFSSETPSTETVL